MQRDVVRAGIEVVALTLGDKGALLVTRDTAVRSMAPRVEVKSKVGAGDSFLAGLVFALSRGNSLADAARLATAAGTAAVIHEGTQLCRLEDVTRLLPLVSIETTALDPLPKLAASTGARDVVCGMDVDPTLVAFSVIHDGCELRFCSLACQKRFEQCPDRYLAELSEESARVG
jgi:bifunctional ADP-heptose synthase (sugar kinase/adenylyltransferase)